MSHNVHYIKAIGDAYNTLNFIHGWETKYYHRFYYGKVDKATLALEPVVYNIYI